VGVDISTKQSAKTFRQTVSSFCCIARNNRKDSVMMLAS
jgi:hypothetical protein